MVELREYKEAGRVAAESLLFGKKLIKEGALVSDVLKKTEEFIAKNNAKCAFPISIARNHVAAHNFPGYNSEEKFEKGDIVKLDVGVHIKGFIADNALSINVSDDNDLDLIRASKDALREAISLMTPGRKIGEIGKAVEEIIVGYGFNPVRNLNGHEIEKYVVHAGLNIPSFDTKSEVELEEGQVFAVEPFATTGVGKVINDGDSGIYRVNNLKPVRIGREVLKYIYENYRGLPFAKEWLNGKVDDFKLNSGFKFLLQQGIVQGYEVLSEQKGERVSQSEHTVIVGDKPLVLTKV